MQLKLYNQDPKCNFQMCNHCFFFPPNLLIQQKGGYSNREKRQWQFCSPMNKHHHNQTIISQGSEDSLHPV